VPVTVERDLLVDRAAGAEPRQNAGPPARRVAAHAVGREPATHDSPLVEACPFLSLHAPAASHELLPVQVLGSSADLTATHAPVVS